MVVLHEFLVPEINDLAKAEGFEDGFTVTTTNASALGDGFMGLLLRVTLEGARLVDGTMIASSQLAVVVKMPPDSPEIRAAFQAVPIFKREASFYSKFYPMLVKFQHDREITEEEDGFYAVPKCYKVISNDENGHYAMILEDLKASGFRMFNKFEVIDLEHVTVFLKRLARYHALSFAIRDQMPEMFQEIRSLKDVMTENMNGNMDQFQGMMTGAIDKAIVALGPFEEFKVEKLEKLKGEIMKVFEYLAAPENVDPFGVLMHGDCWNNNMMYAYDQNGVPNNIRLLDFQLIRYGSPINDLVYFIFTSTNEELRDEHYENFLQIYHTTMCEFITRLGSDGEKLFTFREFKRQLRKFGRYGLIMALIVVQIICAQSQDLPDMEQVAKDMTDKKSDVFNFINPENEDSQKAYNKRISGVVRDIVRLGYY